MNNVPQLTPEQKLQRRWIDGADYGALLWRWRTSHGNDSWIRDGYYWRVLERKRKQIGMDEHLRISEAVEDRRENFWDDMKDWASR